MKKYKNPFLLQEQWSEYELGDPFIMRFNGLYYLYCSSAGSYIKCWTSDDLVDFTYMGSVCDIPEIHGAYAPEVCYFRGKFYMITSPIGSGHYLLESLEPTGPFYLISDNYGLLIDGSFFIDDDGTQYMLRAGHEGIICHHMPSVSQINVNGVTIKESYLNHWTEGPMIIKKDKFYYLTYTGNHLHSKGYRIAYSVSKEGPCTGYVNMNNSTLLLETDNEFHGLGHSSSFLAPDLDSYLITYHNFNLDTQPRKRSLNIDRLFFNGARMYTNPIWWSQEQHSLPYFYTRNMEELLRMETFEGTYLYIPEELTNEFVMEWNVKLVNNATISSRPVVLAYSSTDGKRGKVLLHNNMKYEVYEYVESGQEKLLTYGEVNNSICFTNYVSVRIIKRQNNSVEIYLNSMLSISFDSNWSWKNIGIKIEDNLRMGYTGYSKFKVGNGDKIGCKAIPGKFDAIHCVEEIEVEEYLEKGLSVYSGIISKEREYSYRINVKETAEYQIICRIKPVIEDDDNSELNIQMLSDNETQKFAPKFSNITDESGYETILLGTIYLDKNCSILKVIMSKSTEVDYFEFVKKDSIKEMVIIKDGVLITKEMNVIGHKGSHSMIHKYSGFTCAENLGMGFIGMDGLDDFSIEAIVNRNQINTGDVSIFLRARRESWFHAQADHSLFGYRVKIDAKGIYLYRNFYGEELLMYREYTTEDIMKLYINANEKHIEIADNKNVLISYGDSTPYLCGKVGIEARGEGFGFEYMKVMPYSKH